MGTPEDGRFADPDVGGLSQKKLKYSPPPTLSDATSSSPARPTWRVEGDARGAEDRSPAPHFGPASPVDSASQIAPAVVDQAAGLTGWLPGPQVTVPSFWRTPSRTWSGSGA